MSVSPKDVAWLINSTVDDLEACMKENDKLRNQLANQPKPATGEWTVRQWVDAKERPRNSWDIRDSEGEVVCADLAQDEAVRIADAHNAALSAEREKYLELDECYRETLRDLATLRSKVK